MSDNTSVHTIDEVFSEVEMLRDLFARRLLDDKVKSSAIEKLSQSNSSLIKSVEENHIISLAKELFLVCDRIYTHASTDSFAFSVLDEILEVLERRGIEQILDLEVFDPRIHNSVSVVEANEEFPSNTITAVVRHGYMKDGRVIRPADVVVAI